MGVNQIYDNGDEWAEYDLFISELKEGRKEKYIDYRDGIKGKFVITCIGISSKKKIYLQDQSILNRGFWTQYIDNARIFISQHEAEVVCREFKFNNPKVELIK